MSTILSRIQEISAAEGVTIGSMERSIGASKGVLSRAISNGTDIQSKWIQKVVENYPRYSPGWLLTGEGNMLKSESDAHDTPPAVAATCSPDKGAPYYDVEFQGGFTDSFNDQTIYPDRHIYIPGFERVQVWCNISGHSMEPRIGHQDIIGLRQCLVQDIQFGKIYAVVLKTKRTVKILRKSNNPQMLRYVPINDKEFDEQEFPITDIISIFEVLGGVAKFF